MGDIMNHFIAFLKELFSETCHDRIFLVGGSIRDMLLDKDSKDMDLAAALTSDEFNTAGFRLVEGKSTAPIWFRYDAKFGKIEITPLPDISNLAADLAGRDFTVNAIAMTLAGQLIDPLEGRRDLEQRRLQACSARIFHDDPLRIFRAFRFEADGWQMTPETEALIREQDWLQHLAKIPVERFTREMFKSLEAPEPEKFFKRMLEFRVGENYLPEIFRMPHVIAGPPEYHPEGDLFTHSIQTLQSVSQQTKDPLTRFCAFFHDLGKLATDPAVYPKHHGHEEAGFVMAPEFCRRLRLPAMYSTALAWICKLHGKFNRWTDLRDTTKVRTAEQALKAGITGILPLVASADKGVGGEIIGWGDAVRVAGMPASELGIDLEKLESIPTGSRSDFILQKRVEMLRKLLL
jgi:tRNA nucleotidyltransferase (CCA-adding enzyme)